MGFRSQLRPLAPRLPQVLSSCAPLTPSLPKVACNSQTGVTQHHEMIRTSNILRGNCMRNCRAAPVYARPEAAAEVTIRARGHPSLPGDQRAQVATHPDAHNLSGCAHTLRILPRGMRRQGQGKRTKPRPIGGRRVALGVGRGAGGRRQGQGQRTKPRPIGGRRGACGAWPGFEPTRRAKLAARTASGRAGHAAAGDLAGPQAAPQQRAVPRATAAQ